MNYFAHGLAHLDDPYLLAGTAVPDWLNVADRGVRVRSRQAVPFIDDADQSLALLARGIIQRRMKRRALARETLEGALALFEERGATLWAGRARSEIARMGVRSGAQVDLTPVEQRIAALVAQGCTNGEIAAALSLSRKTVEANLSRSYRKLGVRSRAELVSRLSVGPA